MEREADRIREVVELATQQNKKIVFVFHSFGTFHFAAYLRKYGKDHRVSGMIDIGGVPITMYPIIIKLISSFIPMDDKFLLENVDLIQEQSEKDGSNGN